ncbi:DUF1574 family protein [Candidatus Poribacteria bacterium]
MQIKRVITRFAMFLLIAALLDQMAGAFFETLANKLIPDVLRPNKVRMEEFYGHRDNIDVLFMGSSHAYNGFNPFIFDDILDLNSFNLSGPGQNPTTTYYVLEEVLRVGHRPKLIIIETYWGMLTENYTKYMSASGVFHHMEFSATKFAMFRSACDFPSSLKLLSRAVKNRQAMIECSTTLIKRLSQKEIMGAEQYLGKGYVESSAIVSAAALKNNGFKNQKYSLDQHRLHFLEKTINDAKKRGIQVVLVSTPLPPTVFSDVQGYQELYGTINEIANKHGIKYIDYNILNSKLGMFSDEDFMDDDHLNRSGAGILGEHLGKLLISIYGERLQSLN